MSELVPWFIGAALVGLLLALSLLGLRMSEAAGNSVFRWLGRGAGRRLPFWLRKFIANAIRPGWYVNPNPGSDNEGRRGGGRR